MNKETTRTEKSTPARPGAAARELIRRAVLEEFEMMVAGFV